MNTGDIVTVAGGLFIVIIIAVIANPQYLAGLQKNSAGGTPVLSVTPAVSLPVTTSFPATPVPSRSPSPTTSPLPPTPVPPYRVFYTDKPFSYPVVRLPDNLDTYGASDIRRPDEVFIPFAYIDEQRGGLTRVFRIPYPVWAMDIRVYDNATPNVGSFRMALCYASNGTVIEGLEMIHPGTSFKKIQTSNTPLYLIVSTTGIDGYHIDLTTTREYYDAVKPWVTASAG